MQTVGLLFHYQIRQLSIKCDFILEVRKWTKIFMHSMCSGMAFEFLNSFDSDQESLTLEIHSTTASL